MKKENFRIENIPAVLWGEKSDNIYIYVHGKMSSKEEAHGFAEKAVQRGYQVLSFDLPEHGERKNENYSCSVWNGIRDLGIIGRYALQNRNGIYLYANSLGAYFSLHAYKDYPLKKCLLLSPVLDMERLIKNMLKQLEVSEQVLKEKQKIPTPMGETLDWDYYCYVRENPVAKWIVPTAILYGSKDSLTERGIVETFSEKFCCCLTVMNGGEHWFHTEEQLSFLDKWLDNHI